MTASLGITFPPDQVTTADYGHTNTELPAIAAASNVLLAAGESVVAVAERLGHENATLVLKTYGHLMSDAEDRTRRAIDDA
jgi:integrase